MVFAVCRLAVFFKIILALCVTFVLAQGHIIYNTYIRELWICVEYFHGRERSWEFLENWIHSCGRASPSEAREEARHWTIGILAGAVARSRSCGTLNLK